MTKPLHSANPDFKERISVHASRALVRDFFGIRVQQLDEAAVTLSLEHRAELGHSPGWFQGTIVTAIGELAAAWAGLTLIPANWDNMTLTQTINFTGPARGDRLIARGRVVQAGRTISSCMADIFVVRDEEEHLCAVMTQINRHAEQRPA